MLSFEEFCNKAFETYKACLVPGFSEAEITPYFYDTEAQTYLKSEYKRAAEKIKRHEGQAPMRSIAISSGHCLSLMF